MAGRSKAVKKVLRVDTMKKNPFTIVIIANPVLETPWKSGTFVVDPITAKQADFDASTQYIQEALFGTLPNQQENLLADATIAPHIRVVLSSCRACHRSMPMP